MAALGLRQHRERVPSGLEVLRARIRAARVPVARSGNLRLATWNVRELGNGERLDESLRMIATIIAMFDFVAVIEVRDDLRDLSCVLAVGLRGTWSEKTPDRR